MAESPENFWLFAFNIWFQCDWEGLNVIITVILKILYYILG